MHRTTTTAALLVTVAVSALSGCVTVGRPAAPAPPPDTVPSQPAAPRPDGKARPRPVQAPVREALEMVGPPRQPRPAPHREPGHRTPAPPAAHRPQAPPAAPRARPHREHPRHQRVDPPGFSQPVPAAPDVCALGRKYGGWQPDSPESVFCSQAYGH